LIRAAKNDVSGRHIPESDPRNQSDSPESGGTHTAEAEGTYFSSHVSYHLTLGIVMTFLPYTLGVGIFVMHSQDKEKFTILLEMLKTLLFPLVTLAIGHYSSQSPNSTRTEGAILILQGENRP
jgi:hypothetical protein